MDLLGGGVEDDVHGFQFAVVQIAQLKVPFFGKFGEQFDLFLLRNVIVVQLLLVRLRINNQRMDGELFLKVVCHTLICLIIDQRGVLYFGKIKYAIFKGNVLI